LDNPETKLLWLDVLRTMNRTDTTLALVLLAAAVLGACGGGGADGESTATAPAPAPRPSPAPAPAPSPSPSPPPAPAPNAFSFDEPAPPLLIGFAGAELSSIVSEPGNATNKVVRVNRSASALLYAGTIVATAAGGTIAPIAFAPDRTALTLRVWSPDAGIAVLLKVETADGSKTVASQARVTTAAGWQSLSFDFSLPVDGVPTLDFQAQYVKLVVFMNYGKTGAEDGAKTYYFDDLSFTPVAAAPAPALVSDGVTRRPMSASYKHGNAVAYGYWRGSVLTDADLLQDLALMAAAGFNLVRTYGADAVTDRLLTLAASTHPQMRFQLGAGIGGAVCDSSSNLSQRGNAIAQALRHDNVVAVSVANEAWELSANCLATHAAAIRSQITQPITYNDVAAFWAGRWVNGVPDALLPVIDFASMHIYPFHETDRWDWRQTSVAAGPRRAQAMMEQSLAFMKDIHAWAGRSSFRSASGATAHLSASMPIVIGEAGWKTRQTNPANPIEAHAANPVNQKWHHDLLRQWEASANGPKIFYFVAFDEAWKGTDDGWGLWNDMRQPQYSLCGTAVPAAPRCNADLYSGAGCFN
jgi:exo-beta-1,3-glucanase (GH17 family)